MRRAFFVLSSLLAALSVTAGAAVTTPPPLPLPTVPDTVQLDRLSGPSYLRVPPACYAQECALVVVSHPRGQSAERLHTSPQARVLVDALLAAPFAVLLSDDGGESTWGSPAALAQVASLRWEATRHFAWNGRTYALGLSMGGLLALRSALPGSPYPVSGVALIDGWTDLRSAWGTALTRRAEIDHAYGLAEDEPAPRLNPLHLAKAAPRLPLFMVASPDDGVVPVENSERLFTRAAPGLSQFVRVPGPHLGGNRFSPTLARQLASFFGRLEEQAGEQARKR
ncbi:alpha/beta hydrolase family protein [Deinococcus budaensis]|uniref:Alpha-beta hydrolase superfamily lysophospholipase n=1 Tax=Deinococcus budaensis TaxID=1665626 RepID=A0A7W8GCL5_9DEIO|nr:alpha/beta hydrolase [Deinococcus budaensis]MBB5233087.1 alpha-beta hydrolase superfamily lysophospholipase [Deinococcus budaensis]